MDFLCPRCRSLLLLKDGKLACSSCAEQWEIIDGVIKLSRHPSYWALVPAEEMDPFLVEVKTVGWRKAILSSANPKIKGQYLFTDCPSRADGTFYLSLTPESRVLDLGSGWGSYTFALAPRVGQVVAADSNLDSLKFVSLRAQQDQRSNITAVQIEPLDYGRIPFADGQFDAVIMNGVLEWVGAYIKEGDPLRLQEKCLNEVFRILKQEGSVWIGIENRFGRRYFQGSPDDHLKYYSDKPLAYTTIVPRFIADWMTRRKLGVPYRTYTHSVWGYRRMLKRAGFDKIDFYYPDPDYRAAAAKIYPLASREVKQKMFRDSYFILAEKKK